MAAAVKIKQERHDEAEIQELAAKMTEQHKQHMAKQQLAQQQQQVAAQQRPYTMQSTGPSGQTNIINYLTRGQNPNQKTVQPGQISAQAGTSRASGDTDGNNDSKTSDEESQKGHFGWVTFENGKIHIPYIFRSQEKYCAVRMVEMKLLNKYLNYLHQVSS